MPYLSGPALCEISTKFGLAMQYSRDGGNLSRWMYLKELIEHCIANNKASSLLSFLLGKQQFSKMLVGQSPIEIENIYSVIVSKVINRVNGILYFSGYELAVVGDQYIVKRIDEKISIAAPKIKTITRGYIKELSDRALSDIEQNHFDSAITKSRTLLEEVFIFVIEQRKAPPPHNGKINELYKEVKNLYNMHADPNTDRRINSLLSGFEKIISSITEMRNAEGDAHGVGNRRMGIDDYHARLFVNAATTVADFILSVANKHNERCLKNADSKKHQRF